MYNKLKRILKQIVPNSLIKNNESILRSGIALFYMGSKQCCNLCDYKLSKFVKIKNVRTLCPKCGSISRSRRLWSILEDKLKNKKVLHFSPSKSLKDKCVNSDVKEYITTDYLGEFNATKQLDIENIDEPDNCYDLIICFHVLEHIENDKKAMAELYRILKINGTCYIQTPFKKGDIFEDATIKSEADRLLHFKQKDHVRIYSVNGLEQRLLDIGFDTEVLHFTENASNTYGFSINEHIIVATKKN